MASRPGLSHGEVRGPLGKYCYLLSLDYSWSSLYSCFFEVWDLIAKGVLVCPSYSQDSDSVQIYAHFMALYGTAQAHEICPSLGELQLQILLSQILVQDINI